jgi:hypothetical protein
MQIDVKCIENLFIMIMVLEKNNFERTNPKKTLSIPLYLGMY